MTIIIRTVIKISIYNGNNGGRVGAINHGWIAWAEKAPTKGEREGRNGHLNRQLSHFNWRLTKHHDGQSLMMMIAAMDGIVPGSPYPALLAMRSSLFVRTDDTTTADGM